MVPDKKHFKELAGADASVSDAAAAKKVQQSVSEYSLKNGLARFEVPTKLVLTADEWSPDTGLVTAAFKIRRRQIVEKYREQVRSSKQIYINAFFCVWWEVTCRQPLFALGPCRLPASAWSVFRYYRILVSTPPYSIHPAFPFFFQIDKIYV